ncbi:hypothetical protein JCM10908_000094 [Rhodotorula pacifica]|uniref:Ste50p n=1 Tax=Rhodotorula pacifica TaxID=1495444 RepID=UPI0031722865
MLDLQSHNDAPYATDLLALDADGVHQLLADLGYPHYHEQLHEHGITGDVLVHLDHAALKDVGVHSVGQRLAILKTVYDLKVAQNIPIEEGHYVPPSEDFTTDVQLHTQQVINLLGERDDRIRTLEYEVLNLHSALNSLRDESLNLARANLGAKPRPNMRSPTSSSFPHPLSNASTLSRSSSTPSRPRNPPPVNISSSLAIPPSSNLPDSPNSPVVESPRHGGEMHHHQQQGLLAAGAGGSQHSPHQYAQVTSDTTSNGHHLHPAEISINGVSTPTTPTAQMLVPPDSAAAANGAPISAAGGSLMPSSARTNSSPHDQPGAASGLSPSSGNGDRRQREVSTSGASATTTSTADNPYRSFRVTVEDPCYKVLPAALKKYKINDDWRLYALFICYGNTERCLAYDEKPLLLFQKLKESNDNPVFMLRHIKDIKSPIAVASAKHAARKDKRPPGIGGGVERSLMGVNRDGSANAAAAAAVTTPPANGLAPNARPTRLHHPPVLLPVGKTAGEDGDAGEGGDRRDDKANKNANQGYCIAIYPYLAEREDEFDVAVGDTFVILSKTKGWWVVHRDQADSLPSSATSPDPDRHRPARKSAWVPAGCLLETSLPPLSLLPADTDPSAHGNAASIPIPPSLVVSVSTPGVALMDYSPRGSGEFEVRKGQPLRILKRYNHWSYAIKEDGGRGWLPSWFCGRANKTTTTTTSSSSAGGGTNNGTTTLVDGAGLTPSTPATPTVPSLTPGSTTSVASPIAHPASSTINAASLAPPIHPYAAAAAAVESASAPASTSATSTPTPGHPGNSLGRPDLSVAVSPASLRPSPLPTMSGASAGAAAPPGPRSAGPTMQDHGKANGNGYSSAGGLPSSRSADAALAGAV